MEIQLQPITISDEQAQKQYKLFRKAISKEKWLDNHFKAKYPQAAITYSLDLDKRVMTAVLDTNDTTTEDLL